MDEQGGHSLVIVNLASALGNEACSVGKVSQLRSSGTCLPSNKSEQFGHFMSGKWRSEGTWLRRDSRVTSSPARGKDGLRKTRRQSRVEEYAWEESSSSSSISGDSLSTAPTVPKLRKGQGGKTYSVESAGRTLDS